ncbi:putative spermidine/putrescine transport system substrate-binding protein [Rhodoligotrophos appendicifer]|uniref:extracellular solute-binding protein n=1 Tax=Rhodoligotrophos appendicifer TaxID=987056 RepID=UPI001186FD96|nr:extracellular solute-binding protein [Rhodoligotrophos appendicifer]
MSSFSSGVRLFARRLAASSAVAGVLFFGVTTATFAETVLTYVSFGGALQKAEQQAWLEPFMKANPDVKIVYDIIDYAKLKAMVESGNVVWDLAVVANDFGMESDAPMLEKIDCDLVPCAELQPDKYMTTGYRAGHSNSGLAIGYNTDKVPADKAPKNWADFFDTEKVPGKRVLMNDASSYVFEQALLGDGVAPKDLYPLDLDRAVKKLEALGDDLVVAPSYQGCAELVASGEAVMGGCWTGRFTDLMKNAKAPIAVEWNQGIVSPGYLVIPKGTKNKDLAMKLAAFITAADNNGTLSNFIDYGPINIKSLDKVDPEKKPFLQSSYTEESVFLDDAWYDKNRAEVNRRWTEWLAGVN